mmetsp:Transcript_119165/g.337828  ORF Transcript_119165/g.337828 Transcript_119165/m.337828 type:complete len:209 (-) Transcript_119165:292-918(-)
MLCFLGVYLGGPASPHRLDHCQCDLLVPYLQGYGERRVAHGVPRTWVATVPEKYSHNLCARPTRSVVQRRPVLGIAGLRICGGAQELADQLRAPGAGCVVEWCGPPAVHRIHARPRAHEEPRDAHVAVVRGRVQRDGRGGGHPGEAGDGIRAGQGAGDRPAHGTALGYRCRNLSTVPLWCGHRVPVLCADDHMRRLRGPAAVHRQVGP